MWERLGRWRNRGAGKTRAIEVAVAALVLLLAQLGGGPASAASIGTLLTPFTGADVEVSITLDDGGPGSREILVSVEVMGDGAADIRGVFFDLRLDDADLSGLSATNPNPDFDISFAYGDVIDLGGGSNLHGGGSPCPCDFGVEIGMPGIGMGDDFDFVTFTIAHDVLDLDLSMFFEQSVGVRVTSVELAGGSREGGAKLSGVLPVPEPSTGMLLALGLCAISLRARRRAR